jgi:hypothetical protein
MQQDRYCRNCGHDYATGRKQGVTFRVAVFNWPLVIVAAIVTFLFLL